jgi:hypothetical protein
MSSVGSCASVVSFRGEDGVDLNDCLDELYREIQSNLNDSQCSVRTMARLKEDDEFKECVPIHFAVLHYVNVLTDLFNELKQVSKDVLGRPGKEDKDWYKKQCDERKERIAKAKADAKKQAAEAKELMKKAKKLNIITE